MSPADFRNHVDLFLADMNGLLAVKGEDYTPDKIDRLSNFKQGGVAKLDPLQLWWVYAVKHFNALTTFVCTKKHTSESIRSRFLDLANYCLLGAALVDELYPPAK